MGWKWRKINTERFPGQEKLVGRHTPGSNYISEKNNEKRSL
jgi:hypothetical protein